MLFYVIPQVSFLPEFHTANTIKRFLFVMYRAVSNYLSFNRERFTTDLAGECFDACMRGLVVGQPLPAPEILVAVRAFMRFVIGVHTIVNINGI